MTNVKGRRAKIKYREMQQKHPEKRKDRLDFLKSLRKDKKHKTAKALLTV